MDEGGSTPTLPLFFFGTLMDAEVLSRVVARHVAEPELATAILRRYRRHAVRDAPYPVLRPDHRSHVRGRLFTPRFAEERRRIDHFESEEYDAAPVRVQVGTRIHDALCYVDLAQVFELSPGDWCFDHFRRVEKVRYLRACDGWMADYGI